MFGCFVGARLRRSLLHELNVATTTTISKAPAMLRPRTRQGTYAPRNSGAANVKVWHCWIPPRIRRDPIRMRRETGECRAVAPIPFPASWGRKDECHCTAVPPSGEGTEIHLADVVAHREAGKGRVLETLARHELEDLIPPGDPATLVHADRAHAVGRRVAGPFELDRCDRAPRGPGRVVGQQLVHNLCARGRDSASHSHGVAHGSSLPRFVSCTTRSCTTWYIHRIREVKWRAIE